MSTYEHEASTAVTTEATVKQEILERVVAVNEAIEDSVAEFSPRQLNAAASHLIQAGGKRVRPALSLLVAEALSSESSETIEYTSVPDGDGNQVDVMSGAVAVELIHTFSLIHDDMMDKDDIRRGVPAVHQEYNDEMAILSGDALFSKAFEIVSHSEAPDDRIAKAVRLVSEATSGLCEGQGEDIAFEERDAVSPDEYLDMIEGKTGVLFGISMALPATLLGEAESVVEALYDYGVKVGQAFQIQDDVIDLCTPTDELGKQRGSDLVEGKQTLIALHAKQEGVDVESLIAADSVEDVTESEIEAAVAELESVGSIEYAKGVAGEMVADAEESLTVLPESPARDVLSAVADYVISRGV